MVGNTENRAETELKPVYETRSFSVALDFLEDRLYHCPCCDDEFTERHVRLSKLTYHGCDSDLRPRYSPVDPILYDVAVCGKCGYSSLTKTFGNLSFKNAQIIKAQLPHKFKNKSFPRIYTEDIAINRYKSALMNAFLTRENSGIIAYIYMRLAWIYRTKGDTENERAMLAASLEGFLEATQKELFPVIDLDEETVYYIMGDFSQRLSPEMDTEDFFAKAFSNKGAEAKLNKVKNLRTSRK